MGYGKRAAYDTIRELDAGDIGATYAALGSPFTVEPHLLSFNSSLNDEIYISTDGVTDMLRIASNSFKLHDVCTNKIRDEGLTFPIGTQLYVKEVSGSVSTGSVWVEAIYAEGVN